jgi:hypothetical protein
VNIMLVDVRVVEILKGKCDFLCERFARAMSCCACLGG